MPAHKPSRPLRWWLLAVLVVWSCSGIRAGAAENPAGEMQVAGLRCEFMKTPLGIDDVKPALSWEIRDARRGVLQTAYRVLVASSEDLLAQDKGDLWDSGEVASEQSHLVIYQGRPLASRERCFWKVRVKTSAEGDSKSVTAWSPSSWWEMGLLKPDDWQGSWIQSAACQPIDNEMTRLWTRMALIPQERNRPAIGKDPKLAEAARNEGERLMGSLLPVPVFRTAFEVPGTVRRARVYLSGLGFAESFVNGTAVSDRMFDPSVNYYQRRGGYVTHDITSLVHSGDNVFTAIVGGGWWHESIIWGSPDRVMGQPGLRAQIEVELTDGRRILVPTSASWTTAVGPALKSHYFAGEVHDARRAPGWQSGADDGLPWVSATEVEAPVPLLQAQRCEPERVIERVKPVAVRQPRPGIWVFDMGRMVMGTVQLNVKAPAGTTLVMRTAEWTWEPSRQGPKFEQSLSHLYYDEGANPDWSEGMIVGKPRGGTYYRWSYKVPGVNLLGAHLGVPTLVYVARGDAAGETWHPRFTMHPFRYVEVQGLKQPPTLDLLDGWIISNDEEVVGQFTSANPRFNAIWDAAMNSTRFNTHGMAWDNAAERLQSQVYNSWSAPFASYVLWYPNLWRKIMEDNRLANVLSPRGNLKFGTAIYGDRWSTTPAANFPVTQAVVVELPMEYYDRYGDVRELEKQFPHMKTWCEAFFPKMDGKLKKSASMGAWSDHFYKEMSADGPWTPEWDHAAMMSMMLYDYTRQTAAAARILHKDEDAAELEALANSIRTVINETWLDPKQKTYGAAKSEDKVDTSTGWHGLMAMAIAHDIAPAADVPALLDNCVADMKKHYNSHPATGHITHQILYDVFSDHGLIETCYDMMNATNYPSFTWMLQSGNRTIPEGPTLPESLPAKASACQNECQEPARWFTQTLCGISPDRADPGFKHINLRPRFPSKLPAAALTTSTPYGPVESSWSRKDDTITWTVRIPANSYATALFPVENAGLVKDGEVALAKAAGCKVHQTTASGVECGLGSGNYQFTFPAPVYEPSRLPNQ